MVEALHSYVDPVTEIGEVFLHSGLGGLRRCKAIGLPGGIAYSTPACKTVSMMCHDLDNIDVCHSLSSAGNKHISRLSR